MVQDTMTYKDSARTVRELNMKAKAWRAQEGVIDVRVVRHQFVSGGLLYVVMPRCAGPLPDGCF